MPSTLVSGSMSTSPILPSSPMGIMVYIGRYSLWNPDDGVRIYIPLRIHGTRGHNVLPPGTPHHGDAHPMQHSHLVRIDVAHVSLHQPVGARGGEGIRQQKASVRIGAALGV
jgi:hypothetical protein